MTVIQFEQTVTAHEAESPWVAAYRKFIPPGCMGIIDAEGDLVAIVPTRMVVEVVPLLNGLRPPHGDHPHRMVWHEGHQADFKAWEAACEAAVKELE